MQTIFFAYFYVAHCRLTSHLPAAIVADCRWASRGVGLRWLFVWLFGPSFWLGVPNSWRSGFDTHDNAAGGSDRFSYGQEPGSSSSEHSLGYFGSCLALYQGLLAGASRNRWEHGRRARRRGVDSRCRIELLTDQARRLRRHGLRSRRSMTAHTPRGRGHGQPPSSPPLPGSWPPASKAAPVIASRAIPDLTRRRDLIQRRD
jgi:hypothetical protein